MSDGETQAKGSVIKNWVIAILVAVIVVLLVTNTMDQASKTKFYYFAAFVAVLVFIAWLFSKKKKLDIFKVAEETLKQEFIYTGRRINIKDVNVDVLDSENLVIGFESGGELIAYKWDRINGNLIARLTKKIDEVKNETNEREIFKAMAQRNIERTVNKKMASKAGFEIKNDGDDDNAQ
jgi:uncharacterized membrane protein YobD (UPF0266 family)